MNRYVKLLSIVIAFLLTAVSGLELYAENEVIDKEQVIAELKGGQLEAKISACRKSGAYNITEAVPLLFEIAGNEGNTVDLRLAAIDALARIGNDEAISNLAVLTSLKEPVLKGKVVSEMRKLPNTKIVYAVMERYATANSDDGALNRFLADGTGLFFDNYTQWAGWWTKAKNENKDTEGWYIAGMASEVIGNKITSAVRLGQLESTLAVPLLINSIDTGSQPLTEAALSALYKISGFNFSVAGADNSSAALKKRWSTWWEKNKHKNREEWWINTLKEKESVSNTTGAIYKLEKINCVPAISSLIELLNDDSMVIRSAAGRALKTITKLNFDYTPDIEGKERTAAIDRWKAWWKKNSSHSEKEWLITALTTDERVYNRASAAYHLRNHYKDDKNVVMFMFYGLRDEAESVRQYSIDTLKFLTGLTFDYDSAADKSKRGEAVERWHKWWSETKLSTNGHE